MIDIKTHTKSEIISHLIDNELSDIQKRFYSYISENREEMIRTPIYIIFGKHGLINSSDNIDYISGDMFKKFSVGFLFKNIKRNLDIDEVYIIASDKRETVLWLTRNFNGLHDILFFKDIRILLDENVFIMLKVKIKNRWVRFYITKNDITYKFFKKHR